MTTVFPEPVRCACCGTENTVMVIGSTSAFGSADLDTRPPYPMRDALEYEIARCKSCGYCAPDLEEAAPGAAEAMAGERYRRLLGDPDLPETTRRFACWAEICAAGADPVGRCWSLIRAAWAADDADVPAAAKAMRLAAVDAIAQAHEAGERIAAQEGADEAIEVDLLRRSGAFDAASRAILHGLRRRPEDTVQRVLEFEAVLVDRRDAEVHSISEALGELDA